MHYLTSGSDTPTHI